MSAEIQNVTAHPVLDDEDRFNLAAYAAIVEDDPEEDAIWERYVQAQTGFAGEVLANPAEDVWNDV